MTHMVLSWCDALQLVGLALVALAALGMSPKPEMNLYPWKR